MRSTLDSTLPWWLAGPAGRRRSFSAPIYQYTATPESVTRTSYGVAGSERRFRERYSGAAQAARDVSTPTVG